MSSYPRENQPLAPSLLSNYLGVEVPGWLSARCGDYEYLADLDASVWRVVSSAEADSLSMQIASVLEERMQSIVSEMGDTAIWQSPTTPHEAPIVATETEALLRALDSMLAHGWRSATLSQVISVAHNRAPTIVDLLVALEHWGFGADERWERQQALVEHAQEVSAALSDSGVRNSDPRLGPRIQRVLSVGPLILKRQPIGDSADWIAAHAHRLDPSSELEDALRDLATELAAISQESLEDQIRAIAYCTARQPRDAQIMMRHYGWDGLPPSTLQQIAEAENLTRERIRQICVRAEKALTDAAAIPYAPALDAALKLLDAHSPVSTSEVVRLLTEAHILKSRGTRLRAVVEAARLLGRPTELEVREVGPVEWVCRPQDELPDRHDLGSLRTRAGRLTDSRGTATVETLRSVLAEKDGLHLTDAQVLDFLPLFEGFEWLDEDLGWFWIGGRNPGRNRFLNLLRKALSVADCLPLGDVRAALRRSRRLEGPFPPESVVMKMCQGFDGIEVEGGLVCANPQLDYTEVLQGTELYLVDLLKRMGPVARVEDMWQIACNDGIGKASFWVTLHDSPAIVRFARSTYGLRGVHAPASDVWDVANR